MENSKKPWQSGTINRSSVGAIVSTFALILSLLGYGIPTEEVRTITESIVAIGVPLVTLITSVGAIIGRIRAKETISL